MTTTIRVIKRTRRNATCTRCSAIITWFRTFPRERWIAFEADPVALRTVPNIIAGEMLEELDRADMHMNHCQGAIGHRPDAEGSE